MHLILYFLKILWSLVRQNISISIKINTFMRIKLLKYEENVCIYENKVLKLSLKKVLFYENKVIHLCGKRLFTNNNNKKEPMRCFSMRDLERIVRSYFSIAIYNKEALRLLLSQHCFIIRTFEKICRTLDLFRWFWPTRSGIPAGKMSKCIMAHGCL